MTGGKREEKGGCTEQTRANRQKFGCWQTRQPGKRAKVGEGGKEGGPKSLEPNNTLSNHITEKLKKLGRWRFLEEGGVLTGWKVSIKGEPERDERG